MNFGGSLISDKIFKKILSIGYEFETHDIAKLSLHSNKKYIINSDLTLRLLKEKMGMNSITVKDDNYLSVRIPIGKEKRQTLEEINLDELDELSREFLENFGEEEEIEALEKHENESYLEYFSENRKMDNKETIKFNITNDIGDGDFGTMVKNYCRGATIPKNDMFVFKTKKGKIFDFKFSEGINDECKTFTGVEYVVTYYNPKKENPNVIIDTFVDACSRVIDHLGNLKKINGTLMLNEKNMYTPIGNIGDERCLYHKPKTNLLYMDTYDNVNTNRLKNLGDVDFIAQMTFRSKAEDTLDIIKEILNPSNDEIRRGNSLIESHIADLEEIDIIENVVDQLIEKYNSLSNTPISPVNTTIFKTVKTYIFFIFYKLYFYIKNSSEITYKKTIEESKEENEEEEEDNYLKDFLGFSSRHSNFTLYKKVKEMLEKHYGIKDVNEIIELLCDSATINSIYESKEFNDKDLNEEGEIKYGDPAGDDLPETDKNYGNPLYSMRSYFKHFEKAPQNHHEDWLVEEKIDSYSTTFELTEGEIMLENRSFRFALGLFLKNTVDKKLSKDTITVKEMHTVVNALYGPKIKNMMNLEKNPVKNKISMKCKPGFYRNINFKCIRMANRTHRKIKTLPIDALKKLKSRKRSNRRTLKLEKNMDQSQKSSILPL
jgi:hypothetical protein